MNGKEENRGRPRQAGLWGRGTMAGPRGCPSGRLPEHIVSFPLQERQALLALKGVGPTVVARLEQLGYASLAHLSRANTLDIVSRAAVLAGSSCWKNSPQARAAIQAAIDLARARHPQP